MKYELRIFKDPDGQPSPIHKLNLENNVSKAIDQLSGICAGILADGEVNETEARFFKEWIKNYSAYEPVWPFTQILKRVENIFADGVCDKEELGELKAIMEGICGHQSGADPTDTYSSALPFDDPLPTNVIFTAKKFNITGRFAFGTRAKVMEAIQQRGGQATDAPPSRDSNYLIIGVFASRDWFNTNYGRKIERGVELRENGTGLSIISEEHWKLFVENTL